MVFNSKLLKIIFITVQHFAMLLSPVTRAEEASILTAATVIGSDIHSTCPDPSVLINGFYKTYCEVHTGSTGDKEFVIDL